MKKLLTLALVATLTTVSSSSDAYQLSISQYGRVTATLPYFDEAGAKIDEVIAGAGQASPCIPPRKGVESP
jgi:hypothetical protein